MLVAVKDLSGAALDWAVATTLGVGFTLRGGRPAQVKHFDPEGPAHDFDAAAGKMYVYLQYGSDWRLAGPVIDSHGISLLYFGKYGEPHPWEAQISGDTHYLDQYPGDAMGGPTALVAAMRCIVARRFGDVIDIPDAVPHN